MSDTHSSEPSNTPATAPAPAAPLPLKAAEPDAGLAWGRAQGLALPPELAAHCPGAQGQAVLALLIELQRLAGTGKPFRASCNRLAAVAQLPRETVDRLLRHFVRDGLLTCLESRHGRARIYQLAPAVALPPPGAAPAAPVLPFGKHKGQPITSVPTPYLTWVLREVRQLSPEFRAAITAEVDARPDRRPAPEELPDPKFPHPDHAHLWVQLSWLAGHIDDTADVAEQGLMACPELLASLRKAQRHLSRLACRARAAGDRPRLQFDYAALLRGAGASS